MELDRILTPSAGALAGEAFRFWCERLWHPEIRDAYETLPLTTEPVTDTEPPPGTQGALLRGAMEQPYLSRPPPAWASTQKSLTTSAELRSTSKRVSRSWLSKLRRSATTAADRARDGHVDDNADSEVTCRGGCSISPPRQSRQLTCPTGSTH